MDFTFDPTVFFEITVQGIPLMFIVMGLVWLWGKLGVAGVWQLLSSFATGLLIGVAYMFSQVQPVTFADFLSMAIFGIGLGLMASGYYETQKNLTNKVLKQ